MEKRHEINFPYLLSYWYGDEHENENENQDEDEDKEAKRRKNGDKRQRKLNNLITFSSFIFFLWYDTKPFP